MKGNEGIGFLEKTINERKLRVQDQFMHLVLAQAEKGMIKDGQLNLAHVALLNPTKRSLDETGWMHDEGNMLADMEHIFEEYNGKTIKYHPDGPFVDSLGVIHLKGDPANEVKLNTLVFNVDIQGDSFSGHKRLNQDLDRLEVFLRKTESPFLNDPDLAKLRGYAQYTDFKDYDLKGHEVAEDLVLFLHKIGLATSFGCMSVKDRTLVVAEGVVVKNAQSIVNSGKDRISGISKKYADSDNHFNTFRNDIWNGECASSKVIVDDTKVKYAKFMPAHISNKVSAWTKLNFGRNALFQTSKD